MISQGSGYIPEAFPVGTGIYRWFAWLFRFIYRVPCGYRDIPQVLNEEFSDEQRSLWVQGYTGLIGYYRRVMMAFPVGTGIYRNKL